MAASWRRRIEFRSKLINAGRVEIATETVPANAHNIHARDLKAFRADFMCQERAPNKQSSVMLYG